VFGQLGDVRPSRPPFSTFRNFGFNQPLRSFVSRPTAETRLWSKEKNEKTDVNVNADYTERPEPSATIRVLEKLTNETGIAS
jgi:hypothetical protein